LLTVTAGNFVEEVVESETPVVVDFWADWCAPCRMVGKVLEDLSFELKNVKFVKINADEETSLIHRHHITSIPTLVVYDKREEVLRIVGARNKPALLKELESVLTLN
jgi:thioredoxin 1